MTFTKLFSSITASTIWLEDNPTRIVWITMLAMANKNGFVFASIPGLASIAHVSVSATRRALNKCQEPDPDSRTKDFDGRRIEEVDGGWRLINYQKHRVIRDEEDRREYMKLLMRQKRKQERLAMLATVSNVSRGKPRLADVLAQAEAEAEAEENQTPLTPLSGGPNRKPKKANKLTDRELKRVMAELRRISKAQEGASYDLEVALEKAAARAGVEFERARYLLEEEKTA